MDPYDVGPRLRAAREARLMLRKDLARVLGRPVQWVMRRERGSTVTSADELRAWAVATEGDPAWLLDLGGQAPVMRVRV